MLLRNHLQKVSCSKLAELGFLGSQEVTPSQSSEPMKDQIPSLAQLNMFQGDEQIISLVSES